MFEDIGTMSVADHDGRYGLPLSAGFLFFRSYVLSDLRLRIQSQYKALRSEYILSVTAINCDGK